MRLCKKFGVIFFVIVIFLSCNTKEKLQLKHEKKLRENANIAYKFIFEQLAEKQNAVNEYVNSLSIEMQVAQLFIENLVGNDSFTPTEWQDSSKSKPLIPGGFIFFSYNIADTPEKVIRFTDSIKSYCAKNNIIPPFLAIDQEGGDVCRLKNIAGFLPSSENISNTISVKDAYYLYSLQASQMSLLGFNLNLCPVAEVSTNSNYKFLQGRSFGNLEKTKLYGSAAINGFQNNNIASVIKHFPGNTDVDPHSGLPKISISEKEFYDTILLPFEYLAAKNCSGILMSHAQVDFLDSMTPACLSYSWVTEKLRNEIGYRGLIFSDDIFMGALANNGYDAKTAAIMAIEAGVDIIMISEKRFSIPFNIIIDKAKQDIQFANRIKESVTRIINFKIQHNILSLKKIDNVWKVVIPSFELSENEVLERVNKFENIKKENNDFCKIYFKEGLQDK